MEMTSPIIKALTDAPPHLALEVAREVLRKLQETQKDDDKKRDQDQTRQPR